MEQAKKILIGFFVLLFLNYLFSTIANFLSLDPSSYFIYVLWIYALALFWMLLPEKVGKMFNII